MDGIVVVLVVDEPSWATLRAIESPGVGRRRGVRSDPRSPSAIEFSLGENREQIVTSGTNPFYLFIYVQTRN